MFDAKNAWDVLEVIQSRLVGPLGMKTLDPQYVYSIFFDRILFFFELMSNLFSMNLIGPNFLTELIFHCSDWAYEGNYDNGDQSDNPKIAHGFNYHQGPVSFLVIQN